LDFARATEWILPYLRRPATWVYVTVGLALSGATAHFLQSQISAGFEKVAERSASFVEDWTCQHRKASIKLSDDRFTILVSPLQGDSNRTQTEEIFTALLGRGGVQLVPVCQSLQIDARGEYVTGLITAIDQGKDILKEWHADLILFGKVSATDGSLHIWAVNEHGGCDNSLQPVVLKRGALPGEFESGTKAKLYGAVLKEIAAACRHTDDMNWDVFKKQMRKLTALVFGSTLELREEEQMELSVSYYNGLNLLYNHDGDVAWFEAASSFTSFLLNSKATDPVKLNALFFVGRALFAKGNKTNDNDAFAKGIKVFDHMLPLIPASMPELRADSLVMRARGHDRMGDDGLAIQDLDEAIRLIPVSSPERRAEALTVRAAAHRRKGDEELVVQDLDEAIRLIPVSSPERRANTLRARAETHSRKGDVELAIQDLDDAIRLRPQDPGALNDRCYQLAKIGQLELALADCNESLNLRPNDPHTLDSRGFTYLKLKQPESAINDYDAVLRLDAKQAYSLYGRGVAHLMLGNNDQGNQDIAAAKAIKADITDEFARYGVK
jgi:tetratricopeptide (TPR) repeat protein